jgi:hypothetical protein
VDAGTSLSDALSPMTDRRMILRNAHMGGLMKLDQFRNSQNIPDGSSWANGSLRDLQGFAIGNDTAMPSHTAGTANANYDTNGAHAIGATTIAIDTGTGTIIAGDVVHFGTDTANKYVVKTALTGGNIVLNEGLKVAVADGTDVVIQATHGYSFAVHKSASVLAFRPSAVDGLTDGAKESTIVTDPVSGLALRLAVYGGYHTGRIEVSALYGAAVRRAAWIRKIIG